jgi:ribonuclease T2
MKTLKSLLFILLLIAASAALYFQKENNLHVISDAPKKISTHNLLAISWQNAFCQTHQNKKECRNIKANDFSASHFTLHGLWPQPRSNINCVASKNIRLNQALYEKLLRVMPAAASGLHQHEWKKHGTCYNSSVEIYFTDSITLLEQINNSKVRDFFLNNIGEHVTLKQIRFVFDKAFGQGSGRKVKMICDQGLITELRINVKGNIHDIGDLSTLLRDAPNAQDSCQNGRIDRVGF